jgi:hypothetical protein
MLPVVKRTFAAPYTFCKWAAKVSPSDALGKNLIEPIVCLQRESGIFGKHYHYLGFLKPTPAALLKDTVLI